MWRLQNVFLPSVGPVTDDQSPHISPQCSRFTKQQYSAWNTCRCLKYYFYFTSIVFVSPCNCGWCPVEGSTDLQTPVPTGDLDVLAELNLHVWGEKQNGSRFSFIVHSCFILTVLFTEGWTDQTAAHRSLLQLPEVECLEDWNQTGHSAVHRDTAAAYLWNNFNPFITDESVNGDM